MPGDLGQAICWLATRPWTVLGQEATLAAGRAHGFREDIVRTAGSCLGLRGFLAPPLGWCWAWPSAGPPEHAFVLDGATSLRTSTNGHGHGGAPRDDDVGPPGGDRRHTGECGQGRAARRA